MDENARRCSDWTSIKRMGTAFFIGLEKYFNENIKSTSPILGISPQGIDRRLRQILTASSFAEFSRRCSKDGVVRIDEALAKNIFQENLSLSHRFQRTLLFFRRWFRNWALFLFSFFRSHPQKLDSPVSVFFLREFEDTIRSELKRESGFFSHGPISAINQTKTSVFDLGKTREEALSERDYASNAPFLFLFSKVRWGFKERLCFFADQIALLATVLRLCFYQGAFSLLFEELVDYPILRSLIRQNLFQKVFYSNSSHGAISVLLSDLPKRTFSVEILWYSTNAEPLSFVGEPTNTKEEPNSFHFFKADRHWVWTSEQSEWIKKNLPKSDIEIVGPILFSNPNTKKAAKDSSKVVLLIFDMVPFKREFLRNAAYGGPLYYHEMCDVFLKDLFEVGKQYADKILLKPKRRQIDGHDPAYWKRIYEQESQGILEILDPKMNVIDAIRRASVVVGMPFTSPPVAALAEGVKAAYYDPSGLLLPPYTNVPLIGSRSDLEKFCTLKNFMEDKICT